ncbi:MAG: UDP-N-acetylmuramate--L-alanine ligase [Rickettsiaceae bacterium]
MILLERKKFHGSLGIIHFVGIGGIGMSGIAEIMYNLGYHIQGSDISMNANTQRLSNLGIKIFSNHSKDNIQNVSYVVISTAIQPDNQEVQGALLYQIPVITRSEMLAELMRFKCSIAVSGSHGKTTTTSLIACLFESEGLMPTVINGGIINHKKTNAYLGNGDYLIAEADESDATFVKIPATIAVITNIDPEHLDFYRNFDNLKKSFKQFISNLPFYGFAIACIDNPVVSEIIHNNTERKIITYGIKSSDANIKAVNIRHDLISSTFDVEIHFPTNDGFKVIKDITIPMQGIHNVLNSLAAIAIAIELHFDMNSIKSGFNNFDGIKRRFTKVGEHRGTIVIDDYAHHPVEIKATIATALLTLSKKQSNKLIAIFQPHRFSRLESLFDDFVQCFKGVNQLYISDIYTAGEKPIYGVSSQALIDAIKDKTNINVKFLANPDMIPDILSQECSCGDMLIMMGAGNVSNWANELPNKMKDFVSK